MKLQQKRETNKLLYEHNRTYETQNFMEFL